MIQDLGVPAHAHLIEHQWYVPDNFEMLGLSNWKPKFDEINKSDPGFSEPWEYYDFSRRWTLEDTPGYDARADTFPVNWNLASSDDQRLFMNREGRICFLSEWALNSAARALGQLVGVAGEYMDNESVRDLDVSGEYVYLAMGVNGLQVVNVVDPSAPVLYARRTLGQNSNETIYSVKVGNDSLFVSWGGADFWGANAMLIPFDQLLSEDRDVRGYLNISSLVKNGRIYPDDVVQQLFGLGIVGLSEKYQVYRYNYQSYGYNIYIKQWYGDYYYVSDNNYNGGFYLLPLYPSSLSGQEEGRQIYYRYPKLVFPGYSLLDSPSPYLIIPGGSYALALSAFNDLVFFDLDAPISVLDSDHYIGGPVIKGSFPLGGSIRPQQILHEGGIAYVIDGFGLRAIDIRNPSSPVQVSLLDVNGVIIGVEEGHVYLASSLGTLDVYDFTRPAQPILSASVSLQGMPAQVVKNG